MDIWVFHVPALLLIQVTSRPWVAENWPSIWKRVGEAALSEGPDLDSLQN